MLYLHCFQFIFSTFKDISYYCYLDGIKLFASLWPHHVSWLPILHRCWIKSWMAGNFLQLNEERNHGVTFHLSWVLLCCSELEIVIHAFILLCLEHCNSPFTSLECLQISHSVFLVTLMSHIANANSVTLDPQWTSEFTFRFWFWHLELCMDHILIRGLRTSDQGLLAVHHTRLKTKGDRAFATVTLELSPPEPEMCGLGGLLKSS